ncbi:M23 family metallopeptidase [Stutzerimonas stutzeri]|uniref:M23 family metallopeptidase n=1 Tax=Stutzerimonas stutzeri TaxID=316 RepID=UPI00210C5835|nr:M23 family metallopeptidase [Stutzerimonas stutzeri]MCQ4242951.1 M23 family metallopeptidase [Stutzerimonas stutzeri]
MLISPPFIPRTIAGENDDAFINRAMLGGIPGDGAFPLSFDLNWHGGMHLTAPREGTSSLPVRAIADATLAYFRQPTEEASTPADHGLRYRDQWTDNGCIVLKHETEIGEGPLSTVVFYSVYMHLSKITLTNPTKGMAVYRKDAIGEAGRIYGQNDRIHFEIVADQSQISHLIGRSERTLNHQAGNGRTDSCWGDMYFFVPPEVLVYEAPPANLRQAENNAPVVYRCPAFPTGLPPVQEGGSSENGVATEPTPPVQGYEWAVANQLQEGIFVRMRYERGQCTLTSFMIGGEEIGAHQEVADYEYNLYRTATNLYPQRPSAGYELLRFGRVLGPDTLQPADAAHWRQIALPAQAGASPRTGWVNLNAATVAKFSDADFPHWQGWQLIDDDTDSDSHYQSPFIRSLLRLDDGKVVSDQVDAVSIALSPAYASLSEEEKLKLSERYEQERAQNEAALRDPVAQNQLKRFICKFPSEWTKSDFDTRYGWLKKVAPGGALSEESYNRLRKHHEELAFWEDAALEGIAAKHWHFPPREIISLFRKCGWLSARELAQCIPRKVIEQTRSQGQTVYPQSTITWNTALTRANRFSIHLNKMLRKFLVSSSKDRMSYFLANSIQETTYLSRTAEGGGSTLSYAPWYGRGMMQLTWEENYKRYTKFRTGSEIPTFREVLETDLTHAAESAGFYWVSTARPVNNSLCLSRYADTFPTLQVQELENICTNYSYPQRQCLAALSDINYYVCPQLEPVTRGVNTGNPTGTGVVNGLTPRRVVFSSCLLTLSEHHFPENGGMSLFPSIVDRQLP